MYAVVTKRFIQQVEFLQCVNMEDNFTHVSLNHSLNSEL